MEDIVKSSCDTRAYRAIKLDNGITALLISDHKARRLSSLSSSTSPSRHSTSSRSSSRTTRNGRSTPGEDSSVSHHVRVPAVDSSSPPKISIATAIANYLAPASGEGAVPEKGPPGTTVSSNTDGSAASSQFGSDDDTSYDSDSDDDSGHGSETEPKDSIVSSHGKAESKSHKIMKEKMAAAALCVGVGSFHDPEHLQGLAHFLEHMLFMGSEKYPKENSFDSFLNKHGGSDNAYTECERTVFKMEVHQKHFAHALDIFANFFIAPLMRKESMDRELQAIDSEFQLNLPSDSCRLQQLLGSLSCKGHPMCKFMWGNTRTLKEMPQNEGIDVHAELRKFFDDHYSTEVMTLTVQSRYSLDEMEAMVKERFSLVPQRGAKQKEQFINLSSVVPFPAENFNKVYKVQPMKKVNKLSVTWVLPAMLHEYRAKPLDYIAWIAGYEGPGSILAYLRGKSWALSLVAGNEGSGFQFNSLCSLFNITISLTEEGLKNVKEVLVAVFSFMNMARQQGPSTRIFDEIKTIEENNFRWCEEESPIDYVEKLCESMQLYPPEHYLTGDSLFYDYKPDLIQKCMDDMIPEKANIMIISCRYQKQGICTERETYMETQYCIEDIPEDWKAAWSCNQQDLHFDLPQPNKYIATDFTLKSDVQYQTQFPIKLHEDEHYRLWFKQDNKFNVPKACVYFHLISSTLRTSPENAVLLDLFVDVLDQNMSQETNAAECASLDFAIYGNDTGLVIQVEGFNEKLPVLFDVILDHLANFEVQEDLFENLKKHLHKHYYNEFMKPSKLSRDVRLAILQQNYWSHVEKRLLEKDVTVDSLRSFVEQFRSHLFVEGLVHGNLTADEASAMAEQVIKKLACKPLPPSMIPETRVMQLPVGNHYCRVASFNLEDKNSVITNYYQLGPGDVSQHAQASLLINFMEEPCFDILRTKSQLGYDVNCVNRNTFGIVGFTVTVCCSAKKFSCSYVDEQIEAFLKTFSSKIQQLTEEEFATQVSSLIKLKSCSDLCLQEESNRYWAEIVSFGYLFDKLQREIEFLKRLRLDDFKMWCRALLPFENSEQSQCRKLSVQVVGYGEAGLSESQLPGSTEPVPPLTSQSNVSDASTERRGSCFRRCMEHMHHLHPWMHLKKPDETANGSESSSEDVTYLLQYLEPVNMKANEIFIADVTAFKQGLSIYPFTTINS
uniref:Putative secreted/periplasmic zn-dependent peptidase n=1 Tax=Ornithodoros turicata TaxID=34597 RepID=A0A2R5LLC9_9ACAR